MTSGLTHIDAAGDAHMVDVGGKAETARTAVAEGSIKMLASTLEAIIAGTSAKGDVIGTARLAGIMAAKKTSDLIPLCHPLLISKVSVNITPDPDLPGLHVEATVSISGKTGVEMEALTAVSVACLTLYDMGKAIEKGMEIGGIRLKRKSGGKSGDYISGA